MIQRPADIGAFQFVVLAALRAAQLIRGCPPRVEGTHKAIVIAQYEIALGKVTAITGAPDVHGHSDPASLDETAIVIPSA
jgi:hypothetical protein